MIVVKLGGSLCYTADLKSWLIRLRQYAKRHTVMIVPGGGPFADEVRIAQQYHQFDDSCAHHMAIIAMAQFGLLMAGICKSCQPFRLSVNEYKRDKGLLVWLPDDALLSQKDLPHSWDVSADSLALWLAYKLNARQLVLVKHAVDTLPTSIGKLIDLNMLDIGFKSLFFHQPIKSQIMPAHDPSILSEHRLQNADFNLSLP